MFFFAYDEYQYIHSAFYYTPAGSSCGINIVVCARMFSRQNIVLYCFVGHLGCSKTLLKFFRCNVLSCLLNIGDRQSFYILKSNHHSPFLPNFISQMHLDFSYSFTCPVSKSKPYFHFPYSIKAS